jgi:hypothetical protein
MKVKVITTVNEKNISKIFVFEDEKPIDADVAKPKAEATPTGIENKTTLSDLRRAIDKLNITGAADYLFICDEAELDKDAENNRITALYQLLNGIYAVKLQLIQVEEKTTDKPVNVKVTVDSKAHTIKVDNGEVTLSHLRKLIDKRKLITYKYLFEVDNALVNPDDEDNYTVNECNKVVKLKYADESEAEKADNDKEKKSKSKAIPQIENKPGKTLDSIKFTEASMTGAVTSAEKHELSKDDTKSPLIGSAAVSASTDDKNQTRFYPNGEPWNEFEAYPLSLHNRYPLALVFDISKNEYIGVNHYGFELIDKDGNEINLKSKKRRKQFKPDTDSSDDYIFEVLKTSHDAAMFKATGRTLEAHLAVAGGVPGFSAGVKASASYSTAERNERKKQKITLYSIAINIIPKVKLVLEEEEIRITPKYEQEIKECCDLEKLRELLRKYGAFVPCVYTFGGRITVESLEQFDSETAANSKTEELKASVDIEAKKCGMGGGGGVAYGTTDKSGDSSTKSVANNKYHRKHLGGVSSTESDVIKWKQSLIVKNWDIVRYEELLPYTYFLSSETLAHVNSLKEPNNKQVQAAIVPPAIVVCFNDYLLKEFKEFLIKAAWHNINKLHNNNDNKRDYNEYSLALSNIDKYCLDENLAPKKNTFEHFEKIIKLRIEYFKVESTDVTTIRYNDIFYEIIKDISERNYSFWSLEPITSIKILMDKKEDYFNKYVYRTQEEYIIESSEFNFKKYFSNDMLKTIHQMINHICWHVVNVRRNCMGDAESDMKLFEKYAEKLKNT